MDARKILQILAFERFKNDYESAYVEMHKS